MFLMSLEYRSYDNSQFHVRIQSDPGSTQPDTVTISNSIRMLQCHLLKDMADNTGYCWEVAKILQYLVEGRVGTNGDINTYYNHLQMLLP